MISPVAFNGSRLPEQKSKIKTALNLGTIAAAVGTAVHYSDKTAGTMDKSIVNFVKNIGQSIKNIVSSNEKLSTLTGTLNMQLGPINKKVSTFGSKLAIKEKASHLLKNLDIRNKAARSFIDKKIGKYIPDAIRKPAKTVVNTIKSNPVTFAAIAAVLLTAKLFSNKNKSDS